MSTNIHVINPIQTLDYYSCNSNRECAIEALSKACNEPVDGNTGFEEHILLETTELQLNSLSKEELDGKPKIKILSSIFDYENNRKQRSFFKMNNFQFEEFENRLHLII